MRLELQPHRNNGQAQLEMRGGFGLQSDLRRSLFHGCQLRVILAEPLRKNRGDVTAAQKGSVPVKRLEVPPYGPTIVPEPEPVE